MDRPSTMILGASPAGLVAGAHLARNGWRVTLVESRRLPIQKLDSECISPIGYGVLDRLGLGPLVRSFGALPLDHIRIHSASTDETLLPLKDAVWAVGLHTLSQLLLIEAGRSGVRVLQPARCEDVQALADGPVVRLRDLVTNEMTEVQPDWLIVADGRSEWVGRATALQDAYGLKAHFSGVRSAGDAIEAFSALDAIGYVIPIEPDRWDVTIRVPGKLVRLHAGDAEMVFDRLIGSNRKLRRLFKDAERVTPFLLKQLERPGVRRRWPTRMIPAGPAAVRFGSIGLASLGVAMRSGELVADFLRSDAELPDLAGLQQAYANLWRVERAHDIMHAMRQTNVARPPPSAGAGAVRKPAPGDLSLIRAEPSIDQEPLLGRTTSVLAR